MRRIIKANQDPDPLRIFKERQIEAELRPKFSDFQNPEKAEYVLELLREQGYLCAYCNVQLDFGDEVDNVRYAVSKKYVSIEHWFPQNKCTGTMLYRALEHNNLLGVCQGLTDTYFHCDKQRAKVPTANQDLTINPVYINAISCEDQITFEDGKIISSSNNAEINNDLNYKLNLNCEPIVARRKGVEQGFIEALNLLEEGSDLSDPQSIQDLINKEYEFNTGRSKEDCMIIIDLLKKKKASLSENPE